MENNDDNLRAVETENEPNSRDPKFWRGYRVTRVGGTIYLENEAGVEAFTEAEAEAYALAIIAELHAGESNE